MTSKSTKVLNERSQAPSPEDRRPSGDLSVVRNQKVSDRRGTPPNEELRIAEVESLDALIQNYLGDYELDEINEDGELQELIGHLGEIKTALNPPRTVPLERLNAVPPIARRSLKEFVRLLVQHFKVHGLSFNESLEFQNLCCLCKRLNPDWKPPRSITIAIKL